MTGMDLGEISHFFHGGHQLSWATQVNRPYNIWDWKGACDQKHISPGPKAGVEFESS